MAARCRPPILPLSNPYEALTEDVYDAKDSGSGVIDGTESPAGFPHSLDVDWQIRIAQGERPYPCRYVITTKDVANDPQYTIQTRNWRFGDQVAADSFVFEVPAGVTKIEPEELRTKMSELPGHFTTGGEQ